MRQPLPLEGIKDQLMSAIYNVADKPIAVFDRDECRLIWDALDRLDQYEARAAAVLADDTEIVSFEIGDWIAAKEVLALHNEVD